MNKLKITIEGPTGSGKTTLSLLIADALMLAGFGVNNEDFDVVNDVNASELQERRLRALTNKDTLIDIETHQDREPVNASQRRMK
jgi:cytidylate kinase